MKNRIEYITGALLFIAIFILSISTSNALSDDRTDTYTIGAGDVLEISVWKNTNLTKQVLVLPDGTVHFPLIGSLKAGGSSIGRFRATLLKKLKKYIPHPVLSVSVIKINSMMIYVIGKVNHPGRFAINKNIDVLHALAIAGGLTPFAKEKEIRIFRRNKDGKTRIFKFNYEKVSKGMNLDQNIMLKRYDIIVVR